MQCASFFHQILIQVHTSSGTDFAAIELCSNRCKNLYNKKFA